MLKKSINKINYGDVFRIGDSHILACGDARDKDLVRLAVGQRKIKVAILDVPYGTMTVESKEGFSQIRLSKKILNDDIVSESKYAAFTKDWLSAVTPFLERKNSIYIFNSDAMIFALREGMKQAGVKFSQLLIWIKSQAVIGRKDYLPQHELIAYGWFGVHEFQKSKDKSVLFFCQKPAKNLLHPTQKPVGLIRRLILNSTAIGDTVYDAMSGSGTLGIAAEQTKRSAIMLELDAEYCQIIINRFERLFGLKAKKLND